MYLEYNLTCYSFSSDILFLLAIQSFWFRLIWPIILLVQQSRAMDSYTKEEEKKKSQLAKEKTSRE